MHYSSWTYTSRTLLVPMVRCPLSFACLKQQCGILGLDAFLPFEVDYHRSLVQKNWPDFWYWKYSQTAKDLEVCAWMCDI